MHKRTNVWPTHDRDGEWLVTLVLQLSATRGWQAGDKLIQHFTGAGAADGRHRQRLQTKLPKLCRLQHKSSRECSINSSSGKWARACGNQEALWKDVPAGHAFMHACMRVCKQLQAHFDMLLPAATVAVSLHGVKAALRLASQQAGAAVAPAVAPLCCFHTY